VAEFRLETERLVLRSWRDEDREVFWTMAQDPEVMRYLPAMDRGRSDAFVARMQEIERCDGHCVWAIEARQSDDFLGFCGLMTAPPKIGGIEIGWRLRRSAWGRGIATEAARASLAWGWRNLDCDHFISFTVPTNPRSRAVMERIGMSYVEDGDFDHPELSEGDPPRRHVLYRIERPA